MSITKLEFVLRRKLERNLSSFLKRNSIYQIKKLIQTIIMKVTREAIPLKVLEQREQRPMFGMKREK